MAVGAGVVGFVRIRRSPTGGVVAQHTIARIMVCRSRVTGCTSRVAGVVEGCLCPVGSVVALVAISGIVPTRCCVTLTASGNPSVVVGNG